MLRTGLQWNRLYLQPSCRASVPTSTLLCLSGLTYRMSLIRAHTVAAMIILGDVEDHAVHLLRLLILALIFVPGP